MKCYVCYYNFSMLFPNLLTYSDVYSLMPVSVFISTLGFKVLLVKNQSKFVFTLFQSRILSLSQVKSSTEKGQILSMKRILRC